MFDRFTTFFTAQSYTLRKIDRLCARYARLGRERRAIIRELEECPEVVRLMAAFRERGVDALGARKALRLRVAEALGIPAHKAPYMRDQEVIAELLRVLARKRE